MASCLKKIKIVDQYYYTPFELQRFVYLLIMFTKEYILTQLKTNKPFLAKFGIQNIGLFGSYLRMEQSENSDIDILIDFEPGKESYDNLMKIYDLFEKVFRDHKVEIVTKNGLSPYIGPRILEEVHYV